ncbi:complement decay-accelerating factor isoform X6 [Sturnira hondurensis]|uniref:complement decay-accelerating factor isoform X6 n=1 Tax=Sturnira hondurensis TaxID=192404 RepID=UPI001879F10B|nr:complement decay-accelerating factor isoform X6 [Sturnira hondurensis]
MSPSWRGIPEVLGRLQGLTPLLPPLLPLLLLLLCPQASWGDCKLPPDMPNAQADLKGLTSFPEGDMVTYKCNKGFINIPGKPDTVVCLKGNEWSQITAFCNRSCNVPTRLYFASLKNPYRSQNYFPLGTVVEYECRKGFKRNHSLSGNLTCLQNFTWSKPDEFCKKKSCPNPGEIINGHVNIKTGILFGGLITFSCNTGYELVGVTSSYCLLKGDDVDWDNPFPECKASSQISEVTPTLLIPTTVDVPATRSTAVPRATTPFHARSTPTRKGTPSSGVSNIISAPTTLRKTTKHKMSHFIIYMRLVMPQKYDLVVNYERAHICNTDSFAHDSGSHWLFDLAKKEIRRKCTQVHRLLVVSYKFLEPWTQYMQ